MRNHKHSGKSRRELGFCWSWTDLFVLVNFSSVRSKYSWKSCGELSCYILCRKWCHFSAREGDVFIAYRGRVLNIGQQRTHLMNGNEKVPGWVCTNYWIILLPAEVKHSVSEFPFPSMHLNRSYSRNDFIHRHEPFVCENSRFHSQLCSFSCH